MRKKIVAGNWKMQGDRKSIEGVLRSLAQAFDDHSLSNDNLSVIICPPFPYLSIMKDFFSVNKPFCQWGGQTVSEHEKGAFTGETSANMLKDCGCDYVIVGHSERRHVFNEGDRLIADKFVATQQAGLIPILCLGETQLQREAGETQETVLAQLDVVINQSGIEAFENAILAYEPVWAIGTGLTATPEQAQEVHQQIRHHLASFDEAIANKLSILYGGSVKPNNAEGLFAMADIDGALVGGACTDAEQFIQICSSV